MYQRVFLLLMLCLGLALPAQAEQDKQAPLTALKTPRPAPEFSHQDTAGNTHAKADYLGKVLVVNFWATWCPPCVHEMPSLQRASEALKDADVQVLAINMGEDLDAIGQFTDQVEVDFPLLLDDNMLSGPLWEIKGLPTTYVIDGEGQIRYVVLGDKEWDDPLILEQIRALQDAS